MWAGEAQGQRVLTWACRWDGPLVQEVPLGPAGHLEPVGELRRVVPAPLLVTWAHTGRVIHASVTSQIRRTQQVSTFRKRRVSPADQFNPLK